MTLHRPSFSLSTEDEDPTAAQKCSQCEHQMRNERRAPHPSRALTDPQTNPSSPKEVKSRRPRRKRPASTLWLILHVALIFLLLEAVVSFQVYYGVSRMRVLQEQKLPLTNQDADGSCVRELKSCKEGSEAKAQGLQQCRMHVAEGELKAQALRNEMSAMAFKVVHKNGEVSEVLMLSGWRGCCR